MKCEESQESPFYEGQRAFFNGRAQSANPYMKEDARHDRWLAGYLSCAPTEKNLLGLPRHRVRSEE